MQTRHGCFLLKSARDVTLCGGRSIIWCCTRELKHDNDIVVMKGRGFLKIDGRLNKLNLLLFSVLFQFHMRARDNTEFTYLLHSSVKALFIYWNNKTSSSFRQLIRHFLNFCRQAQAVNSGLSGVDSIFLRRRTVQVCA